MNYIVGIDIGTTSTKALLYDLNGKIYAKSNIGYTLHQEQPDMAEEDPNDIFTATLNAIEEVVSKAQLTDGKVVAISWSAQQHSLIALGKRPGNDRLSTHWSTNPPDGTILQASMVTSGTPRCLWKGRLLGWH